MNIESYRELAMIIVKGQYFLELNSNWRWIPAFLDNKFTNAVDCPFYSQADGYDGEVNGALGTFQQDMAILKLNNANLPTANIIPIAGPEHGLFAGREVRISGWGKTESEYLELVLWYDVGWRVISNSYHVW